MLRLMSRTLDDLLEAAENYASGKPTQPVPESGSRELRALARSFNSMVARLEDDDAHRRGLLADVSHELRTPLTILRGNIDGLLDGVYTPDEARLNSLLDEIKLLDRLVDDLRILSLAESGTLALQREPTDLVSLLGEAAAAFQSDALSIQTSFSDETLVADADPWPAPGGGQPALQRRPAHPARRHDLAALPSGGLPDGGDRSRRQRSGHRPPGSAAYLRAFLQIRRLARHGPGAVDRQTPGGGSRRHHPGCQPARARRDLAGQLAACQTIKRCTG
jgi:hypothetical protein